MRYFIDTNIFLRILTGDLPDKQEHCLRLLNMISVGKIKAVCSQLVIAEIVWTLTRQYKFPKSKVVLAIAAIYKLDIDFVETYKNIDALDLFEKNKAKYVDCLIASIPEIQNKKWTVVSYDKDFDKLGVTRIEPKYA